MEQSWMNECSQICFILSDLVSFCSLLDLCVIDTACLKEQFLNMNEFKSQLVLCGFSDSYHCCRSIRLDEAAKENLLYK